MEIKITDFDIDVELPNEHQQMHPSLTAASYSNESVSGTYLKCRANIHSIVLV